jgi:hypothetical protein
MEHPSTRQVSEQFGLKSSSGAVRFACVMLIVIGIVTLLWRTRPGPSQNPRDFETLYAGSYCLTHHCNPYDVEVLNNVLLSNSRVPSGSWTNNIPIYPPTTLTLIAPLSFLPFTIANFLWYTAGFVAYTLGICWLFLLFPGLQCVALPIRAIAIVLLTVFPKAVWSLNLGNPNLLVTSLLIFITFDDKPSRQNLRLTLFGAACLLKPQLSLPFLLLIVLRSSRTSFKKTLVMLAVLAAVCASVFVYASAYPETAHWRTNIAENLRQAAAPGMSMDPSVRVNGGNALLNLQYLFGYWIPKNNLSQALSLLVCALLGVLFLWAIWKLRARQISTSSEGYLLAAATLAALVLLPVYHRFYDGAILILAVPWIIFNLRRGVHPIRVGVPLILLVILYKNWLRSFRPPIADGLLGQSLALIQSRYESLSVLLLACILLSIFLARQRTAPDLESR